jgi:drug/metabolite transporter (DMT)-like permease
VTRGRERLALVAFLAEATLAGGNAVGVRFSNRELAPLWGAGLRFSLAGLLLLAIMAALRLRLPRGRALGGAALYGLTIAGAFALAYEALVHIHGGLGQTVLALVPLATLLLAVAQRQERLRLSGVVGCLLAVGGVAVVYGFSLGTPVPLLSLLAVLGAVLCFAEGTVVLRRYSEIHPVTMNAVGMAAAAVVLVAASLFAGEPRVLPTRAETWIALGYIAVIGSIVVFVLYMIVVRLWNASRASYAFVITPVVTVLLSAWLDDEPIGLGLVLGGLLILVGVYIGALRPARAAVEEARR